MDIRRLLVLRDTVNQRGRPAGAAPVTRVAACAVIRNPLAGIAREDLGEIVPFGEELGALLVREALAALPNPAVAYGKAAIVGVDGDLEHAAAIIHPRMGTADARGDRRRQGDHPVQRQGGGGRRLDRRAARAIATTSGCSTISTRSR